MPRKANVTHAEIVKPNGSKIELDKSVRPATLLSALHEHHGELRVGYMSKQSASGVRRSLILEPDIKRVFDITTEDKILIARKYN